LCGLSLDELLPRTTKRSGLTSRRLRRLPSHHHRCFPIHLHHRSAHLPPRTNVLRIKSKTCLIIFN
jgi:hypothetical protein